MTLIPWLPLAVIASILAVVFGIGPGAVRRRAPGLRGAVLRWGHAATWAALALAALVLALGPPLASFASLLGLVALGCYLGFLVALLARRPS